MSAGNRGLLDQLADGSLPPAAFGHARHVEAAWQCLQQAADRDAAERRFVALLRGYVAALGAEAKYHHTLTIALLRLIETRRRQMPQADWETFAAAHPELFGDARSLVARHYSAQRLDRADARQDFVEPDLAPLP
ncbi:hypothetical protein [Solimonas flava]|uniref:hypothetical protein n=1 Tax=Solimonas flava TaxID=415849 RepID=UPI0004026F36|nr:hypothetical protein [Solimonas flava]